MMKYQQSLITKINRFPQQIQTVRRFSSAEKRNQGFFDKAISLRGGVKKATVPDATEVESEEDKPRKQNVFQILKRSLFDLPSATRTLLLLVFACNILEIIGSPFFDAKLLFVSDWPRTVFNLELWRPFTSAFYLGPISMHWATNIYFLVIYGSHLETVNGTAEQAIFLLTAFLSVTILGFLIGLPVVSTALISSCIYGSSRVDPLASVPFQFGLRMPRWLLPYGLAAVDFLQAGSVMATVPHIVGILAAALMASQRAPTYTGHFYTYNRNTLPLMGGRDWLKAPNWLKRRLEGKEDIPDFLRKENKRKSKSATD